MFCKALIDQVEGFNPVAKDLVNERRCYNIYSRMDGFGQMALDLKLCQTSKV